MNHETDWPTLCELAQPGLRTLMSVVSSSAEAMPTSSSRVMRRRSRDLWLEKRGHKEPADLSEVLPVLLGCWTEPFNRQWFEQLTGRRVSNAGEVRVCGVNSWRRATLDGIIKATGTVFEAKHTSAFAKPDEVLERYMPQLQHNMAVTGHQQAALSVIFGNHKFEVFEIAADWLYQIELLEAETRFWTCVLTGEQPVAVQPPPAAAADRYPRGLPGGEQRLGLGSVRLGHASRCGQDPCDCLCLDQEPSRGGCLSSVRARH